ncbi:hypothetical protein GEV33_012386 [Tenebrio molitor]|uniref:Uncharacterized protein n=1 Tax=Tenebrio molitor TaxID=7067 RepID=A0A8J6H8V9_TENMO|nr:hypothetical protein GEV33_012386 [Tenebrio molitor]
MNGINQLSNQWRRTQNRFNSGVCKKTSLRIERSINMSILEQDGSAVDAAIATMFCNGIFTMQSMGLGGGFLMTIYIKENETAYTLNARETAPMKASPEMYRDNQNISRNGPLAIAVPGELRGYHAAHQRFGKLEWAKLIEPSIKLCEKGYQMSKHQYDSLTKATILNDTNLREWFYDSDGNFKKMGSTVVPKQLCETLKVIAKNGGDDLYNGTLGEMLLEDLKEMGSIITKEDLENYKAEWMDPIMVELRHDQKLYSVPPPGSGVLLGFIMKILDGFKFKPEDIDGIHNTVLTYHKIIEAFKYAYAKRTELGDTSFVNITNLLHNLTSPAYAESIRKQIKDNSTSDDPEKYGAVFYSKGDHGTAHISVLAENGDAVSVTSSINLFFGAGLTSKQTGIILNSVMDDFSFPYFRNYFNLPGSPNNALQPGKRPLSSMSPSILVDRDGDAKVVIGASGGTKITTAVALAYQVPFTVGLVFFFPLWCGGAPGYFPRLPTPTLSPLLFLDDTTGISQHTTSMGGHPAWDLNPADLATYTHIHGPAEFPSFEKILPLRWDSNPLAPGPRPRSTVSDSHAATELPLDNTDRDSVMGSPGRNYAGKLHVLMRTIWFGQNIKEAVDAPRIHHQLFPMEIQYEYGTLQQVVDGLKAIGHKTNRYKDAGSIICALLKASDYIYANADHRKGGDSTRAVMLVTRSKSRTLSFVLSVSVVVLFCCGVLIGQKGNYKERNGGERGKIVAYSLLKQIEIESEEIKCGKISVGGEERRNEGLWTNLGGSNLYIYSVYYDRRLYPYQYLRIIAMVKDVMERQNLLLSTHPKIIW